MAQWHESTNEHGKPVWIKSAQGVSDASLQREVYQDLL
jgi:hypothetical protein